MEVVRYSTSNMVKRSKYRIVGNVRGRRLSRISQFCGYSRKFSPQNLGAWRPLAREQSAKVFSTKIVLFTSPQKFSPSKVFRCTVRNRILFDFYLSLPHVLVFRVGFCGLLALLKHFVKGKIITAVIKNE